MTAPCHNCPNRFVGCHSSCREYGDFKEKVAQENAAKYEHTFLNRYYYEKSVRLYKQHGKIMRQLF